MRVLLLDDEACFREALAANLELEGFDVTQAQAVVEAVEMLKRERFDILVSDVCMPDCDGLDGLVLMRTVQHDLPAIFVTGHDADGVREEASARGAHAVLPKPVAAKTLADSIREASVAGPRSPLHATVAGIAGALEDPSRNRGDRSP